MEKKIFALIKKNCKEFSGDGAKIFALGEPKGEAASPREICYICEIPGITGTYSSKALDLLMVDPTADISMFLLNEKVPELKEPEEGTPIADLPIKEIKEASKFVSKDDTRPVLEWVHFTGQDILATDGYKAYICPTEIKEVFALKPELITALKSVKGELSVGDAEIILRTPQGVIAQVKDPHLAPDMRQLMQGNLISRKKIVIPYKALKQITDKKLSRVEVAEDGSLSLFGLTDTAKKPLPVKAEIIDQEEVMDLAQEIKILMPLVEKTGLVSFDCSYLVSPTLDKEGNCTLFFTNNWLYYL